jgi:hypothetical protein
MNASSEDLGLRITLVAYTNYGPKHHLVSKKGKFDIFTLLLHYNGLQLQPVTFKA